MKVCRRCKIEKPNTDFHKCKANKDGLHSYCKPCASLKNQEYRVANHERLKIKKAEYNKVNKERIDLKNRKYYQENRDRLIAQVNQYYLENKEHLNRYRQEYRNNRKQNDVSYRIRINLRSRLYHAIKSGQKKGSAVKDLGCSIPELKLHLENQFQPGMSWENYGKWHIDHIKPLSRFDLTAREQFLQACHYTNLQPLWEKDNLTKGAKTI